MNCPLCDTEGAVIEIDDDAQGYLVSCPGCSEFSITRAAMAQWKQSHGATRTGPLQLAWIHLARSRSRGEFPAVKVSDVWGWAPLPPSPKPPTDTPD
jgi:hypothetical protein